VNSYDHPRRRSAQIELDRLWESLSALNQNVLRLDEEHETAGLWKATGAAWAAQRWAAIGTKIGGLDRERLRLRGLYRAASFALAGGAVDDAVAIMAGDEQLATVYLGPLGTAA
jgi:hypothetical protein